ncbi:MAG: hypothetical protein GXY72_00205 [Deltaproteobacteria bacterium]|nr:hypothetical protein [Deltaproteobacteria bacterium]
MKIEEMTKPRPGDLCLVCGAPPAIIGIFTPENQAAWGAPIGKSRFFRYCLCSRCQGQPDTPDRVEKIIRAELDSGDVIYRGEIYAQ